MSRFKSWAGSSSDDSSTDDEDNSQSEMNFAPTSSVAPKVNESRKVLRSKPGSQLSKKEKEEMRQRELEELDDLLVGYIDESMKIQEVDAAQVQSPKDSLDPPVSNDGLKKNKKKKRKEKRNDTFHEGDAEGDEKREDNGGDSDLVVGDNVTGGGEGVGIVGAQHSVDMSRVLKSKFQSTSKKSSRKATPISIAIEQSRDKSGKKKKAKDRTQGYSEISY